jgi:hypothetical protein
MKTKKVKWLVLSVVGILATTWIAVALQNRRIDNNALKNAGKTNNTEDWLMYGLKLPGATLQSAETDRCVERFETRSGVDV